MKLFSPAQEGEVFLVFDIGSGSVGGAIVWNSKTEHPTILYSTRSPIEFKEEITGSRLHALMLRALSEVMLAIVHEGFAAAGFSAKLPRISEALVCLSSPWAISRTLFLELRNEEPARMTEAVFSALLRDENEHPSGIELPEGAVAIEKKLVRAALNGYETPEPYEKTASLAEFTVCSSFSLPKIVEKISDTITHLIHPGHISFHSFSLLAFATLRDIFPQSSDFIFLDVNGEQSEISIVKRNVLVETITFPCGKNHLIRALGAGAALPAATAESFIKLAAEGKGDGPLFERSKQVTADFRALWLLHFEKAVSAFSQELFLPRALYLTSDDAMAGLLRSVIETGDFTAFTLASAPFSVTCIDGQALLPHVSVAPSLAPDPFLSMETIFASRVRAA